MMFVLAMRREEPVPPITVRRMDLVDVVASKMAAAILAELDATLAACAVPRASPALDWMVEVVPTNPACKHGRHDCDRCGTHDERDHVHTTVGGRGSVGWLMRRG